MSDLFPKKWLDKGVDPSRLSKHTVQNDRWDREDLDRMLLEVTAMATSRDQLTEFVTTGEQAIADAFWTFLKSEPDMLPPDQIRPSHVVNRHVIEEMQDLDETRRLRRYTVNDDVQAALAAHTIEPDLETLFDRRRQQQKAAEEFEDMLRELAKQNQALSDAQDEKADIDAMVAAMQGAPGEGADGECETCGGTGQVPGDDDGDAGAGQPGGGQQPGDADGDSDDSDGDGDNAGDAHGDGTGQPCPDCNGTGRGRGEPEIPDDLAQQQQNIADLVDELQKKVDEQYEQAQQAAKDLEDQLSKGRGSDRSTLKDAVAKAADEAQATHETSVAWGLDPGQLQRMDAQERMDLAKRLNNDRFRRVAELFGPMRNLMLSEQQRKTTHSHEEVYDVGIGNDLGRVLPQELLMLHHPQGALDFRRKFVEGKLMQYELQGIEKLARGAIIFCEDGSGSMSGEREMWAKAVMLCLMHLARQQHREMHVLHFGSPGQIRHMPFTCEAEFTMERILDAAELFFGGGTDFVTPMDAALEILSDEFDRTGKVTADVVFVTDDECMVPTPKMDNYLAEMARMQSTTWGISVSGADRRPGALMTMSEGKVATIKDFYSGDDIRDIFRGV